MHACVADISFDDLRAEVPVSSVDICTMVFVLSAVTPAKMPAVRARSLWQFARQPAHQSLQAAFLPAHINELSLGRCLPHYTC